MRLLTLALLAGAAVLPAQTIAVVNQTKGVTDAFVQSTMNAVAQQVHNEYKAKWGYDATFVFVGKGKTSPAGAWNCNVVQTKGDYHTVTRGVPVAYCHVSGVSTDYWTNTVSHEVLEMRTDPFVNTTYTRPNGTTGYVEVCDACEQNDQGYRINTILMSDFVYPSWFQASGKSPYDYRGLITAPFQLLPGGYLP